VAGGLALSLSADTPAGPSIVVVAALAFAASAALGALRPRG
jgi:ABC-type Mn2+/Zn2+ transport system permease subunit